MTGKKGTVVLISIMVGLVAAGASCQRKDNTDLDSPGYSGTQSCRECHENFYQLWAPSHHGLAMQPFTAALFKSNLTPHNEDLAIGNSRYRVEFDGDEAWMKETAADETKRHPLVHAMGGKNVYYFLTTLERGRLQVLPLAYDVQRKAWFDTAASGIRHFRDIEEEVVDWRDPEYTFNTSCYMCHVSQLTRNYDLETDTYNTVWLEPGINCEACHGSAAEHVRVCEEAGEEQIPEDLKIESISHPKYSRELVSDACASCHAKASPLSASFPPGDSFFDHFDLGVFELPEYYPDGRDLGENYTYTQWLISPCANSGQMDCLHCHTSSGRYRFVGNTNKACLPCHAERVENAAEHSHHPEGSDGNQCVSCHMPMTEFARMRRSDHSMLPPTPSTTIAYDSPNACNICHHDQDAAWADKYVRQWRKRDYQAPVLLRASLIEAARKQDWSKLPAMLEYLASEDHDAVFSASLIRLLRVCDNERKWPHLIRALKDPSPLVRAAAAESLGDRIDNKAMAALIEATRDEVRLVRVRAAVALAPVPRDAMDDRAVESFDKAVEEFRASLNARPDYWASYYNMGNFLMARREFEPAIASFKTAIRLEPNVFMPYVNASLAYNALGQNDQAEQSLRKAYDMEPESPEVNLNLGLLLAELKRTGEAKTYLQTTLKHDPESAVAAYNLGILHAEEGQLREATGYLRKAYRLRSANPKYGYSLAFYLQQSGNTPAAVNTLERMAQLKVPYLDAYLFLGAIYLDQGRKSDAINLYKQALGVSEFSPAERKVLQSNIAALQN